MAISREVLLAQRDIAMEKGYLTKSERETFERYIDDAVETNPTHLPDRYTKKSSTSTTKNLTREVYEKLTTPVEQINVGGTEVEGYQNPQKNDYVDYSGGFNDMIDGITEGATPEGNGKYWLYGLGAFIVLGIFGT